MTASLGMSFDYVMEIAYAQTITILYKYFYVWRLNLRLNNIINYYSLLSSLSNFGITSKPLRVYLRFRYYKQVSSSFCDIIFEVVV